MHLRQLVAVAVTAAFTGLSASAQENGSLPFWRLQDAPLQGPGERTARVVTERNEFRTLWDRTHAFYKRVPPLPAVDFSREMVLVVSMGLVPVGSSFRIARVEDVGGELRVLILSQSAGPNCIVPASFASPVEIVRLARYRKPARFVTEYVTRDCK